MLTTALISLLITISQGWQLEVVDSDKTNATSISIDSCNNPHIAYGTTLYAPSRNRVNYAYLDGESWNTEVVFEESESNKWIEGISLALDPSGNPHIAFEFRCVYPNEYTCLMYSYWNGSSWVTSYVDNSEFEGARISLALDSSGNPNIAYKAYGTSALKYASWNGYSWDIEILDSSGWYPSLAIDSNDNPHIVYGKANGLEYSVWNGSEWEHETIGGNPSAGISLILDSSNNVHISYGSSQDGLHYVFESGSSWENTIIDSGTNTCFYSSIDLTSQDWPHIVYGPYLNYAYWNGTEWILETIETGSATGVYNSLALDQLDRPHISFANDGSIKNLSCASNNALGIDIGESSSASSLIVYPASPNPSTGTLSIGFTLNEPNSVQLFVYDVSGRLATSTQACLYTPGTHSTQLTGLSEGIYVCRVITSDSEATQKFVVID